MASVLESIGLVSSLEIMQNKCRMEVRVLYTAGAYDKESKGSGGLLRGERRTKPGKV